MVIGMTNGFNPRARGGRDLVSVYARYDISRFNPRARGGRDKKFRLTHTLLRRFQSTRPRGARLPWSTLPAL